MRPATLSPEAGMTRERTPEKKKRQKEFRLSDLRHAMDVLASLGVRLKIEIVPIEMTEPKKQAGFVRAAAKARKP